MKNKVITYLFMFMVVGFFLINLFLKDIDISYSERRKLQQFPKATLSDVLDASFFQKFETYSLDQFAFRDQFRSLKANIEYKVLRKLDNNKVYMIDNNIFKIDYPLRSDNVKKNTDKFISLINAYLTNNKIYYCVVPEKSYYNNSLTYLKYDYEEMFNEIDKELNQYQKIDILNELNLDSYYLTDPHWKQEKIELVANKIIAELGNQLIDVSYDENVYDGFYGSYYNEAALNMEPEKLVYLTSKYTEQALVKHLEYPDSNSVYNVEKLSSIDSYNIFLDGASSIIEITNPLTTQKKELIIFRDSFGSSLAPLLVPYYSKITIIDIRYINSQILADYVDFSDQDVLFLYSTLIYNTNILK